LALPWHLPSATPSTATAFPQRLIGALMGALARFPPSTLFLPEVLRVPPGAPWSITNAEPWHTALATEAIPTALPHALIGALMGALSTLPPPTELSPDVPVPPWPPRFSTSAPPGDVADAMPSAPIEFPLTAAGRAIGELNSLPPRTLLSPLVLWAAAPMALPAPIAMTPAVSRATRPALFVQFHIFVLLSSDVLE
jgi:hypothetical protein